MSDLALQNQALNNKIRRLGQDPLSLIADELKKYQLYFDARIAA